MLAGRQLLSDVRLQRRLPAYVADHAHRRPRGGPIGGSGKKVLVDAHRGCGIGGPQRDTAPAFGVQQYGAARESILEWRTERLQIGMSAERCGGQQHLQIRCA
ncbi:hypothetical protein D3C71_1382590 [compost metagenome]